MNHTKLALLIACLAVFAFFTLETRGAPILSLVKAGTSSTTADSVIQGSLVYNLDLLVNTDGLPVTGLQYYFTGTPAVTALKFGSTALTALNNPFTGNDVFRAPATGAPINQSGATTVWFKASDNDYPAIPGAAIGRYGLDTSLLPPGTYVITPIGQELTNANTTVTTFAPGRSFSLTVTPEPGSALLFGCGGMLLLARRRNFAG